MYHNVYTGLLLFLSGLQAFAKSLKRINQEGLPNYEYPCQTNTNTVAVARTFVTVPNMCALVNGGQHLSFLTRSVECSSVVTEMPKGAPTLMPSKL